MVNEHISNSSETTEITFDSIEKLKTELNPILTFNLDENSSKEHWVIVLQDFEESEITVKRDDSSLMDYKNRILQTLENLHFSDDNTISIDESLSLIKRLNDELQESELLRKIQITILKQNEKILKVLKSDNFQNPNNSIATQCANIILQLSELITQTDNITSQLTTKMLQVMNQKLKSNADISIS
ncbi:hypothetical protein AB837_00429 [bacterium AB1]|nr:hypothetical protein AB837_00429 [bacterium AB1]